MSEDARLQLEAIAQRLLEHPKDLEPREPIRRYKSLLRLWSYPAFGVHTTWTILQPGKKADDDALPMVREVAWDRPDDDQQVERVRPTIRIRDAFLCARTLQEYIATGAELSVPPLIFSHRIGLDGEYFGLETFETSPFVRLQWWCEGPIEWRHLIDWAAQVRRFLTDELQASKDSA